MVFPPRTKWYGASEICLKFNGSCLKQDTTVFNKLKTVPIDLRKLSDVVDKNRPKKSKYKTDKHSFDK